MILLFVLLVLASSCNSASSSADFTFCFAVSHDFSRFWSRSAQDDIRSLRRLVPENSFKSSETPVSASGSFGWFSILTSFFHDSALSLSFSSHSLMRFFSMLDFEISCSSFSVSSSSDLCLLRSFLT